MHLDWLTLKFTQTDVELERAFINNYLFGSIKYLRFTILIGVLFIGAFGALDLFLSPNNTRLLWSIRFGILCPASLLVAATTYSKRLIPWLPLYLVFTVVLTACGFTVMILYSPPPINYLYYTGLITVLMYSYTLLRLRFMWSTLAGWMIVFIYIISVELKTSIPTPIYINNIFFLVASNMIGMMASYSIEYYARKDFYLMNKMEKSQNKMAQLNMELESRVKKRTRELEDNNRKLSREIEERKVAETALRESEATNRALIQAIPDQVFWVRKTGEYLAVHASDPALLLQPVEVLHKGLIGDFLPKHLADQFMEAIGGALVSNAVKELNYSLQIGGEEKRFEARVVPSVSDTVIMIIRDITEHTRAMTQQELLRAQLQQAQKMESLGTLAGGLAHDMNNVLGAILNLASANLEASPSGSQAHHAFDIISKAAIRGGDMVKSLLSFARQSPVKAQEFDVNTLLREEIRILERTTPANLHIELDLEENLKLVCGDASALSHALMNLCINAVDAMPELGTLTLRSRNVDQDWIEIRVEDTGVGMSKDVLERALEPFFTTKATGKGTGLGLSMAYSAVKAHKGRIEIQSLPGHGTQVSIRLPACKPVLETAEPGCEQPIETTRRSLKVLLVDDDDLIQSSMQVIIQSLGHAVTGVPSGETALETLETGYEPDVVILDMNMPGLGGSGTLPRLRALLPEVPVLLSTGRVDQVALNLAEAHPHVSLLPKPFSLKELRQRFEGLAQES
jgi:signal transduction histidine kinase